MASEVGPVRALATPKSLPAAFFEDRRSIYWENNIPRKDYSKTTRFVLTSRQEQLFYSKRLHPDYIGDRTSPIWTVSEAAKRATSSPCVVNLAQPKHLHPEHQQCKEVMTAVPPSALKVRPSERLHRLARHKTYPLLPIKTSSEWDWGEWSPDISEAVKTAQASPHVIDLAVPKKSHVLYQPCRQVQWCVSQGSVSHVASERLQKLARPKNRHGEDYNPHAWSVSRAAILAQASPRVNDLATPLPRKCRTKK